MAKVINQSTMVGSGSSLTMNGSTFQVGLQSSPSAFKSVGSGLPSGVSVCGQRDHGQSGRRRVERLRLPGLFDFGAGRQRHDQEQPAQRRSYHTIYQGASISGLKVLGNTFDGQKANGTINGDMVLSENVATISNNEFFNLPADGVNTTGGVIEHNYFSGASYQTGAHADAISVHRTVAPVTIRENYIDFIKPTDAAQGTNSAVKIVSHFGTISDVTIEHNILLGGGFNSYVGQDKYAVANVRMANNLMGLSEYGDKEAQFVMPGNHGTGFVMTGNSLFSAAADGLAFAGGATATAPVLGAAAPSAPAITPPVKAPPMPASEAPATPTQDWSLSAATTVGTERQDGISGRPATSDSCQGRSRRDQRGAGNDIIVGGKGMDWMAGQAGDDVFLYTSINVSQVGAGNRDIICDWGKLNSVGDDKIDLHLIDADTSAAGNQAFTWIGSNAFSGKAGEIRSFFDGQNTVVELTVNNDKVADMQIQIGGHAALNAHDFAL